MNEVEFVSVSSATLRDQHGLNFTAVTSYTAALLTNHTYLIEDSSIVMLYVLNPLL
jgi:hypothetical protein